MLPSYPINKYQEISSFFLIIFYQDAVMRLYERNGIRQILVVILESVSASAVNIFGPVADKEIRVEKKTFWARLVGPSVSMRALVVSVALALVSVDTIGAFLVAINVLGPVADEKLGVEKKSFGAALVWPSVTMRALVELGAVGFM